MPDDVRTVADGRYRLLEVVGEGGMAEVWRAEDHLLKRDVAVKILRPQFASDPEFLARFQSEARAAAGLNHPGIVAVYDVGREGAVHYLVMEYVPGADLKERERQGVIEVREVVRIAAAMADAVGYAHAAGLIHRDIKPQNVILAPDGRIKVADFGIARAIADAGTTAPGIVMGTVHYLSPEQASGAAATTASDVYGLGVVLYEMLSGRLPHEAESSVGVAVKIASEDAPPVDSLNPQVPATLAGIVAKAMARDPGARYQDASELAAALHGYTQWAEQSTGGFAAVPKTAVAGAAVGAPPPSSGAVAPKRQAERAGGPLLDRNGLLLAVVAVLAVAGLIPLWNAVINSIEPGSLRPMLGLVPPPTPEPPTPTPTPPGAVLTVPDLRGVLTERATKQLRDLGLGVTLETRASVTSTADVVLHQSPPADGQPVPPGTVVGLVVSGEPLVTVPSANGAYDQIAGTLLDAGLEPVRRDRWGGASSPAGSVMSVDPPPGSRLPRGSTVHVTVNSGSWLPIGVDFDDHLHLSGVDLPSDRAGPGQILGLAAYWEATGPITGTYRSVAELVGPQGVVARDAHVPGGRPTNTWAPGDTLRGDGFNLAVPPDLAPGAYRLIVGLEDEAGGTRVPLVSTVPGFEAADGGVAVMTIQIG